MDHLKQYYQFIDEFNTVSRTFSTAPPDPSQPEMRSLTAVAKRHSEQIFNECGFEVVPCLFQSLLTVYSSRYIFTRYSFNFTNDRFETGAKHFNYADTNMLIAIKWAFRDSEVESSVKDALYWQPLALDADSGLSLAHLPKTKPQANADWGGGYRSKIMAATG